MKTILITGAAGYLGKKTVELFTQTGWQIRATDLSDQSPFSSNVDYRYVDLETADEKSLRKLTEGVDVLLHIAGYAHHHGAVTSDVRDKYFRINSHATKRLAQAAEQSGRPLRFVFLSTGAIYGSSEPGSDYSEESPCHPEDAYAESKMEAENNLKEIFADSKSELVLLRMSTLYGEGDPGNMKRLIASIAKNRFLWIDSGKNRKTFIYVDDAAAACQMACIKPIAERTTVFNVCGTTMPTGEILKTIYRLLDKSLPRIRIPGQWAVCLSKILSCCFLNRGLPAKLHRSVVKWLDDKPGNGLKFERELDFKPSVSFEDGLKREIDWMRSIGEIPMK